MGTNSDFYNRRGKDDTLLGSMVLVTVEDVVASLIQLIREYPEQLELARY